jgi:O-methyltransferase involved in polyketide biosynthesis
MIEDFTDDFTLDFGSIEETMLGPLWARVKYSKLYPELLNDLQAVQIIDKINYDFIEISNYLEEWRSFLGFFNESYKN